MCVDWDFNINTVLSSGETQDLQKFSPSDVKPSFVPYPNCLTRYDMAIVLLHFTPHLHLERRLICLISYLELTSLPYVCFSLSSEQNNVACPTTASIQEPSSSSAQLTPRKKTRKKQKRKGKKKQENKKEKQRQRHRMPSGVPEQESGSSLVQILV